MMRFLLAAACLTAFIFASAQKPKVQTGMFGIHAFYAEIRHGHEPEFVLRRTTTMIAGSGEPESFDFIGILHYPDARPPVPAGAVIFAAGRVLRDSNNRYRYRLDPKASDTMLGRRIRIATEPVMVQGRFDSLSGEVYAPLAFKMSEAWKPVALDAQGRQVDPNEIGPGMTIRWNPDSNNTNKVYVSVTFSGRQRGNESIREGIVYWPDSRNMMVVPDNGSIALPKAIFHDIPEGAICTLSLYRANYTFLVHADGTPTRIPFVASSFCTGDFRYRRRL